MEEFKQLELSALYEILAINTARYTQMLANGIGGEEFKTCKETILHLQSEIETRKKSNVTDDSQRTV